jgi:hypothetical protein
MNNIEERIGQSFRGADGKYVTKRTVAYDPRTGKARDGPGERLGPFDTKEQAERALKLWGFT